jgi:hypothetical protein
MPVQPKYPFKPNEQVLLDIEEAKDVYTGTTG